MAAHRIVHSDAHHCVASWRNVLIVDIAGDIDVERTRGIARAIRNLLEIYPDGFVEIALVRASTPAAMSALQDLAQQATDPRVKQSAARVVANPMPPPSQAGH